MKEGGGSEELKRTDEGTMIRGAIRRGETPRRNVAAERWKIGGRSVMAVVVVSGGGRLMFGDLAVLIGLGLLHWHNDVPWHTTLNTGQSLSGPQITRSMSPPIAMNRFSTAQLHIKLGIVSWTR